MHFSSKKMGTNQLPSNLNMEQEEDFLERVGNKM